MSVDVQATHPFMKEFGPLSEDGALNKSVLLSVHFKSNFRKFQAA